MNNPILDALGLENRRALERAVQQSKLLPEGLGPAHVALGRSGEFVVSTQPEPSAVPRRTEDAPPSGALDATGSSSAHAGTLPIRGAS